MTPAGSFDPENSKQIIVIAHSWIVFVITDCIFVSYAASHGGCRLEAQYILKYLHENCTLGWGVFRLRQADKLSRLLARPLLLVGVKAGGKARLFSDPSIS